MKKRRCGFKRTASLCLAVLSLVFYLNTTAAFAVGSDADGWTIHDGTLVITDSTMPDYSPDDPAPWHPYADRIRSVRIENNVRRIGAYALSDLSHLEELTIPDTVSEIGIGALAGCGALVSLTLPCLPVSVNAVERTFYPFGSLFGNISYENSAPAKQFCSVIKTGESEFRDLTAEKVYYLPKSLTNVHYTGDMMPPYTFFNCAFLSSVRLSGEIPELYDSTFRNCVSLSSLFLDHPLTAIGHSVFSGCTSVVITYPGDWAKINLRIDYTDGIARLILDPVKPCAHTMCAWKIVKKPTCLVGGERQYVCQDCLLCLERVLTDPLGHGYMVETIPATCEKEGVSREVCMRCGDVQSETILSKTDHVYEFVRTEGGKNIYLCRICGDEIKTDVPPEPPVKPVVDPPVTEPETNVRGDVNGDGLPSARDLFLLCRFIAGLTLPTDAEVQRSDLNGDGTIGDDDADLLAHLILEAAAKEDR